MTAQVNRKWKIECYRAGKLEWYQPFVGTRGEAEMVLDKYRAEGERAGLINRVLKVTRDGRL